MKTLSGTTEGIANSIPGDISVAYQSNPSTSPHEIAHNLGQPHAWDGARRHKQCYTNIWFGPWNEAVDSRNPPPRFPNFWQDLFTSGHGFKPLPTLGPMNASVEELVYGINFARPGIPQVIDPKLSFELMGYAEKETRWISAYTYKELIAAINDRFPVAHEARSDRSRASKLAPGRRLKLIRGRIDGGGSTAHFLPFLDLDGANASGSDPAGNASIILRDAAGVVQGAVAFRMPVTVPESDASASGVFNVVVEVDDSIRVIELESQGSVLARATATASHPVVALSPLPENFTVDVERGQLNWDATDPDGGVLTHFVQLSRDGGATWETLGVDLVRPQLTVSWKYIGATANALLRVITSDGFHSTSTVSVRPFRIAPHAPSVEIVSPVAGAGYFGQVSLHCEAVVGHVDETVVDAQVTWISDQDGWLGTGRNLTLPSTALSAGEGGTNVLTVIVTDSRGLRARSSVSVVVGSRFRPVLEVEPLTEDGTNLVRIIGDRADTVRTLEYSTDLVNWVTLGDFRNDRELLTEYVDTSRPRNSNRFYRARTR